MSVCNRIITINSKHRELPIKKIPSTPPDMIKNSSGHHWQTAFKIQCVCLVLRKEELFDHRSFYRSKCFSEPGAPQNDKGPLTVNVLFLPHCFFSLYFQIPPDVAEQLIPEKSKGEDEKGKAQRREWHRRDGKRSIVFFKLSLNELCKRKATVQMNKCWGVERSRVSSNGTVLMKTEYWLM